MASITYNDIYSVFFQKVSAYDFLNVNETQVYAFLCSWLHSVVGKPYIRRVFDSISMDDEIQVLTYELKTVLEDESDQEFVKELLGVGVAAGWLEPKVNSTLNTMQVFGSSEEKFYSQSAHLTELRELLKSLKHEQRQLIADRSVTLNGYLGGS